MRVTLESLASCFQGLLPSLLFTCSKDGIPNAAMLSHVDYVDASHVALSFQFFNKSRRNIAENPWAEVAVTDPDTGQGWCLTLRYVRSETEGPTFERMALRIEAIASYCGLKGVFKLLAADVYEVLDVEATDAEPAMPALRAAAGGSAAAPAFTMRALQDLLARINRAESLEGLLDSILAALEESVGFTHSMILVPGEDERVLVAIASRGYPESGIGAEARYGEGIIGVVAEARKPIRISGLLRGMLYALAMARLGSGQERAPAWQIAMPGLPNPESQLGVPLLVRGELVGVLCIESETPYRFHEEDRATIELLGSYLAIAIQNMQLQERATAQAAEPAALRAPTPAAVVPAAATPSPVAAALPPSPVPAASTPVPVPAASTPIPPAAAPVRHEVAYYGADECILIDGEYLIRSLPARILWKLLTIRQSSGRAEFTNRELRLDKTLNLPEWKDNLESRLLLLRRRLEQKCPTIRLVPRARGRFALEVDRDVVLQARS